MKGSTFLIILSLFVFSQSFAQSHKKGKVVRELIGTWEFVELRDSEGNKVDTIWFDIPIPGETTRGYEIPAGPLMVFNEDGTYSFQFTPVNTDYGEWSYDEKKKVIDRKLIYSKPQGVAAQYLIDMGYAKKDKNGNYYELHTDEVVVLTSDKLIIKEKEGRQRTFRKRL
jgi:hypothetical protein